MQILYKIQDFATLSGTTVDTLLFYEKKGLFLPIKKDSITKYRFYSTTQLPQITLILQLKGLGFSLNEIQEFNSQKFNAEDKIDLINKKIEGLNSILNVYKKPDENKIISTVKQFPQQKFANRKTIAKNIEDLKKQFDIFIKDLISKKVHLKQTPQFCIRFFDEKLTFTNINCELLVAVDNSEKNNVKIEPAQKYLCALSYGNYDNLIPVYAFLFKEIEKNNYKVTGFPVEQYVEAYGTQADEINYVTEVRIPIE